MKVQTLVALVVAVVMGLGALLLVLKLNQAPDPNANKVGVVIAKVPIEAGMPIGEEMIQVVPRDREGMPESIVTDPKKVVGMVLRVPVVASEAILAEKIAPVGASGLTSLLQPNQRAVTTRIKTEDALAGFAKPGDKVDISLIADEVKNGKKLKRIETLLQNVVVLALNDKMSRGGDPENQGQSVTTVTFALTPDEANVLALAESEGQLKLSLRGPNADGDAGKRLTSDQLNSRWNDEERAAATVVSGPILEGYDDEGESFFDNVGALFGEATDSEPAVAEVDPVADPEPVKEADAPKLDMTALAAAPKLFKGMFDAATAPPEEEPAAEADEQPAAPAEPRRKLKRLVYRDLEGNVLWDVMLFDDSTTARGLADVLEDVDPAELAAQGLGPDGQPLTADFGGGKGEDDGYGASVFPAFGK